MRSKLVLMISVGVGVAAFWLTATYLRNEIKKMEGREQRVWAVAAKKDLPAGTTIEAGDLALAYISRAGLQGRAVLEGEYNEIIGRKLVYHIARGGVILWSDVGVSFMQESGLAETISINLRAISIPVDAVSSVSALVKPNDHVDILGTFTFPSKTIPGEVETVTMTVLQDVTVLATGQNMANRPADAGGRSSAKGYNTITLEVTPREAELLAFLQSVKGRVTLSLRNSSDVSFVSDLPEVNFEHIESQLPELNLIRQRDIRHKKDLNFNELTPAAR